MNREMLEEIRFLLNTHLDSKSPMGLILAGQTELWKKLQLQAYTAIRQRIDVQSVLNHYDRSQTGAYIRRQLDYAGCGRDIFTDAAIDAVYQYTSGTAKMIEAEINGRGTYFHVIVGKHRYGNYICIPNHDIGCELSDYLDIFWNRERLSQHLKKVDATTVAYGLVHLKEL